MDSSRCLKLLKNAKTDNERMAALLLVTRTVECSSVDDTCIPGALASGNKACQVQ